MRNSLQSFKHSVIIMHGESNTFVLRKIHNTKIEFLFAIEARKFLPIMKLKNHHAWQNLFMCSTM